ncbi:MAG: DUF6756 family protein [Cytophagales bacterium]|nr:DUF6756 family protein [Cytophagales bacterium]
MVQLCQQLNIPKEDFSEIGIHEWRDIDANVWTKFSNPPKPFSIWDSLILPHSSIVIDFSKLYFKDFIEPEEAVWFILDDSLNGRSKFWYYEGKVAAFDQILDESYLIDELIVVSKKLDWILTFDHHWVLSGTGPMKSKIESLKKNSQ